MTATRDVDEVRRSMSPMERWYWVCDQISPLNVVARVHVRGACAPRDLDLAAEALVREHPLLRVAVDAEPDGSRPRFVGAASHRPSLRVVETEPSDVDRWVREVDDVELALSLDWRTGPLVRLVDVVRGRGTADECHDVILTVSHVIADGTTALELLRRLVELAAGAARLVSTRPALPPPEAMLPKRINGLPRAAHFVASVLADGVAAAVARPRRLTPATPVESRGRRTRLIRRELTAAQVAELADRCRRAGVTVHSALTAAMAIALAGTTSTRTRVTVGSPVDFRAELEPPVHPTDAGAYVATVPSHVQVAPAADLWTVARGAHRDLRRRKRFHQHLALVSLLRLMSPRSVAASARAVAMVDRVGPGNVCLSNIGRYDFPDRAGDWALSGAQFIADVSVSGYLVATVNTSHAALHWNFTYIEGAVSSERAEQFAERAVRALLSGLHHTGAGVRTATRG
ncbi:phthiocerol/phthiodiolone dimycocerosyl transferase family protein [Actinophytocola sp.]|uniref:phthiocerol/phthiodiolone dimycocerosyl transferase family protein n=1 Tax=Actinophytocola sp. TaxID=1872138 RepID=UPI002ED5588E